ncbi:hypothetical protein EPUS_06365 [Endocarpon pusillum Z07020]|uniref:WW domain-containing protein n=1 Tax=Endocarpon pusillum (strain Z07020 / HMAS-L-300199) TaxID=1263415 RepID=U1GQ54_ENDPU|nr:uncharacterized protein EPUS_06365 [Endocarpon pusillum Z07020]ERF74096.1 hypothetical protein EPUS_06365 [Endocarpon pusillum Z07020]
MSACSTESSPEAQDSERNTAPATRDSPHASHEGSDTTSRQKSLTGDAEAHSEPPLPAEEPPPLPQEVPPAQLQDDGWDPVWDDAAQTFYFYNRFTKISQWENPRLPAVAEPAPPGVGNYDRIALPPATIATDSPPPTTSKPAAGGYDPAIHGDYDPTADYAQPRPEPADPNSNHIHTADLAPPGTTALNPSDPYAATGTFNRFTGKWQSATLQPENFNDDNKSKRQMNAYFDVDAAANSHDGKSLKAERSGKKLTKKELKAFKDKRREKKEERRRAWLRD